MNVNEYRQNLESASRRCIQNGGTEYREYHEAFKQKSVCVKLWLICKAMPSYVWLTWFAPVQDKYTYTALRSYLSRQINGNRD